MARVCVIGGGPAGATFATRMAMLGHAVTLVERAALPRPRVGEALTPGVLPLLEPTGARRAVEAAGFPTAARVVVRWDGPERVRDDPGARGLLVDRGRFDALLLDAARAAGVRVLQPARIVAQTAVGDGWRLDVLSDAGTEHLPADLLAEAGGRAGAARRTTGPRTLAVHGYWQGKALADGPPRVEAGRAAWFWSVPLPDGRVNVLAFVDPRRFHTLPGGTLAARYLALLGESGLGLAGAELAGPVGATDATPGLADDPVAPTRITIGDAALALDPLSSSGVQHALRSALAGAVVANTLLRRPSAAAPAMAFYHDSLRETADHHAGWTAERYASVAAERPAPFWAARAAAPAAPEPAPGPAPEIATDRPVEVAPGVEVVPHPCVEGDFVAVRPALRYPGGARPVAFVGGQDVIPFLRAVRPGSTPVEIASARAGEQSFASALALTFWLVRAGILVERCRPSGTF